MQPRTLKSRLCTEQWQECIILIKVKRRCMYPVVNVIIQINVYIIPKTLLEGEYVDCLQSILKDRVGVDLKCWIM